MLRLIPLLLTVLLELFAFSMILPILPFLIKDLGGSNFTVTNITGIFAFTSFFFAPLWGGLSDRYGRKPILLAALFLSAINYVWMSFSHLLWMVLLSRVVSGLCSGWMSVAQSWVADLTDRKSRTAALGMLGATFGIGFAAGPALGGLLIDPAVQASLVGLPLVGPIIGQAITLLPNPHQFPILVAGFITMLMVLGACWWLPNRAPTKHHPLDNYYIMPRASKISATIDGALAQDIKQKFHQKILAVFFSPLWRDKVIGRYLLLVFLGQVAFSTLESVFALWGQANFSYTAADIGYIFAFIGLITIVVQGGLIRLAVKYMGEKKSMQGGLLLLVAGFLLLNFFPSPRLVWFNMGLIAVGFSIYQPALQGSLSQHSPFDKQGAVLGLSQSLQSLARGLGAMLLGGLFTLLGNNVYLPSACLFLLVLFLTGRTPDATTAPKTTADISSPSKP